MKIEISERLRKNIILMRKNKFLSSYELSSQSGHSKYWLPNIESGKTKKIKKSDLISIYKILCNTDDENEITEYIESILNQQFGSDEKNWYDLIKISDMYKDSFDETDLENASEDLLNEFNSAFRNSFDEMSVQQKQAVLTSLLNICYSLRKNPSLTYTLMNVPVYGVDATDKAEFNFSLKELLTLSSKYQDLADKNNVQDSAHWYNFNQQLDAIFQKSIHLAYNNFIDYFEELETSLQSKDADLYELSGRLTTDICFVIERGQPNALKLHLQHFRIYDGQDFAMCIKECYNFFVGFEDRYELPSIYDHISYDRLESVCNILNTYGEIRK